MKINNIEDLKTNHLLYNDNALYNDYKYDDIPYDENPEAYGYNMSFIVVPNQNNVIPILFINSNETIYCVVLADEGLKSWLEENEISAEDSVLFTNKNPYHTIYDNLFFDTVHVYTTYQEALKEVKNNINTEKISSTDYKSRSQQHIYNGIIDSVIYDIDSSSYRCDESNEEVISVNDAINIIKKHLKKY